MSATTTTTTTHPPIELQRVHNTFAESETLSTPARVHTPERVSPPPDVALEAGGDADPDNENNPVDSGEQCWRALKGKLFAANLAVFLAGVNDAVPGALVPTLQEEYSINTALVSLTFLTNFFGFISAAFANNYLTHALSTGSVFLFGALLQTIAYILLFWAPPYPLYVAAFYFSGFGVALQDAQANVFCANLPNHHRWLGIVHANYGVGALIAPLIATALATKTSHWSYVYLAILGVAIFNVLSIGIAFRGDVKSAWKRHSSNSTASPTQKGQASDELKRTLRSKTVWLMAAFFFLYVGTEVTAGGWIVEFLIRVRGGTQEKVGYVASGFWAGLTVGRLCLAEITHKWGERKMILLLLGVALVLEFTVWFIPSILSNAITISFFGFMIGPFFPAGIAVLTRLLPREMHVSSIGFVSTTGQAGSAAFPFLTGAIAASKGVKVLQPVLVALLAGMAVTWVCIPRVARRSE